MADSDSESLGCGLRVCMSNSFPGDAGATGTKITLNSKGRAKGLCL